MNRLTTAIMDDLIAAGFVPAARVGAIIDRMTSLAIASNESLEKENTALRREVNELRARLGLIRKYVEWSSERPTGGCPVSGG